MASFGDHPSLPESLESILTDESVSTIFLKAECKPRVKSGHISSLTLNELDLEKWNKPNLLDLSEELSLIVEQNSARSDCFIEIEREGCKVMQIGDLRVSCAWPPFSDAWEITVVRPVANLQLSDYELDKELVNRLSNHHRGIFVVGKPGSGKTTFAQAIASYLDSEMGAMVKTMESPRDLQVPQRVTQYAPLEGDLEKTAEIIFLLRPDFVIFDEVRRARDFEIFADVRLAGVGLLGVTHANSALEAIQRLIGKVELGLVSQVLDTILHVEAGKIQQVLELRMTVKAPTGMQEELARPVIEVVEFPSGKITHEMFAFGSEIAVVPVDGTSRGISPMKSLAKAALIQKIREWIGVESQIQILSDSSANIFVPSNMISTLVGRGGENIRQLQDDLGGIALSVKSLEEMPEGMENPRNPYWYDQQDKRSKAGRAWEHQSRGSKGRGKKGRKGRR